MHLRRVPIAALLALTGLVQSADALWSNEWLDAGGVVSLQAIDYGPDNVRSDAVRLDRAVLRLEARVAPSLRVRVAGDLVGKDTRHGFEEAWLEYVSDPRVRLTLGLIRIPMGTEFGERADELPFQGYAFPAYLDGRTDVGLEIDGETRAGGFYYDVFGTIGAGFDPQGEERGGPMVGARQVSYPWRGGEPAGGPAPWHERLRRGFFVGLGATYATDVESSFRVANPFRNVLFDAGDLEADRQFYFHWNLGLDAGPVCARLESARGSLMEVRRDDGSTFDLDDQRITAWAGSLAWMITGEPYDARPYRQRDGRGSALPRSPAWGPGARGGLGAWEVAARYANGDIDRTFFDEGVTTYDESSQEFRSFSGVVNWYPVAGARLSLQVVRTIADQEPTAFQGASRDTTVALAGQLAF